MSEAVSQGGQLVEAAAGPDPATGLAAVAALRGMLDVLEELQVDNARAKGWSWSDIARLLGVSKQAMHYKHASRAPKAALMTSMAQRPPAAGRQILRLAEAERRQLAHPYLGDEHLLLGVLAHASNPGAVMLTEQGLDLPTARAEFARIVSASGPIARDDADLLQDLGIDVAWIRRELESTFGTLAVQEAARHVRSRPWWRGRAQRSPLCGPPYLIKRAQFIACTTAGKRGQGEVTAEDLLYGVLRVARDPLGAGLSHRGRREIERLGLHVGGPHPVRLLLTQHGIDPEQLGEDLLTHRTT